MSEEAKKTEEKEDGLRTVHKPTAAKIKKGDLMAFIYFVSVDDKSPGSDVVYVKDLDANGTPFEIRGTQLIERGLSADQFQETQKVSQTAMAEILVTLYNRPFTVGFKKKDGSDRTLRGRLVSVDGMRGYSNVEDLDVPQTAKEWERMRKVDHRTLYNLIVDGVSYELKKK